MNTEYHLTRVATADQPEASIAKGTQGFCRSYVANVDPGIYLLKPTDTSETPSKPQLYVKENNKPGRWAEDIFRVVTDPEQLMSRAEVKAYLADAPDGEHTLRSMDGMTLRVWKRDGQFYPHDVDFVLDVLANPS